MTVRRATRLVVVLALLLTTVVASAAAGSAQPDDPDPIRLKAGEFTPDRRSEPRAPSINARGHGYYIVQFDGPIVESQAAELRRLGADLVAYIPDFAYKVRMTPAVATAAAEVAGVTWIDAFVADYKLSPGLAADGLYRIRLERGADVGSAVAAIAAAGANVLSDGRVIAVQTDRETLEGIAEIADVAWIENYLIREKHNEFGAGVIVGTSTANANGYDGSTQIVAVADTGIGDGTAGGAHPDIPAGRIVNIFDWPTASAPFCYTAFPDGAQDVDSGHGTHVAGSVLSDGSASGLGKGSAPAASLVFQSVEDYIEPFGLCAASPDGYYLTGLPDDLEDLLQQAYNAGARIHSDSWGSDAAGDYTADAASVDNFMWSNQDFLMTTSAGNAGVDNNNNGVVDADSTGSPATAKNVLTVGASENDRADDFPCDTDLTYVSNDAYQAGETCSSMGGTNILGTAGQRWGFGAEPLASDITAGNAEQMAPFSSRGPTDDGRIKPDIVAPGTWILSGYSSLYQQGYGTTVNPQNGAFQSDAWGMPISTDYKYMGGTSMSNPIAAGAAAVVRDFYNKAHSHNASGALVKATLINSAVDLLDENNDGVDDNDFPIPNIHEGWGRIDAANATDGSAEFDDNTSGLTTGGSQNYTFDSDGTTPFKVTLVWADFPSTETASSNLVNDLDLTVSGPGGTYLGNVFSNGWSTTGGSADRVNNVENVYLETPAAGTYTVTVSGFNVPFGPQPFAIVVEGAGTTTAQPPVASFTSSCTDLSCDFTDTSTDLNNNIVSWSWEFGDGSGSTQQNPSHAYTTAGSYTVELTVTDGDGLSDTTTDTVTVTDPVGNNPPTASFASSCVDLGCDFTDTSTDGDGSVVTRSWDFGDGNTSTAQNPSHSYATAGDYTVTLTVTDDDGATDATSNLVTVTDPVGGTDLHVGDLDGASVDSGRRWNAQVTIAVHDDGHAAVSGATVTGSWSAGANGSASCTTDGGGMCVISKSVRDSNPSVTFTVTSVTHATLTYDASANHDPDGDSTGTVIVVPQDAGGNQPPVASFTSSCDGGLECTFTDTSTDPDSPIVSWSWNFGDGGTSTTQHPTHTYAADGAYTVTLTVTDNEGASDTATETVIVGNPPAANVHVGDLDGSSVVRGNGWRASVTITVHNESEAAVSGATVTGTWTNGASGTGSCVTNAAGQCTATSSRIGSGVASATFTVGDITGSASVYDGTANHDPETDSDGTVITVFMT